MGFDIAIVTKNKVQSKNGEFTDTHCLLDRGFCTMILNAKNHHEPVLSELEKALGLDLSFLLKPEYYNPQKFSESNLREMGLDEEQIKSHKMEMPSGFVKINSFLDQIDQLLSAIETNPNYESQMTYDRDWWHSYFDKRLQIDLKTIKDFLTKLVDKGETEFSFDVG
jgi:hypothetical protein